MSKKKDDLADLIGGEQPAADTQEPQVDEPAAEQPTVDEPAAEQPTADESAQEPAVDPGANDLDKIEADRIAAEIAANKEKLAAEQAPPELTPVDPAEATVLEAHLRRQANWDEEAKGIFFGKTEAEQRREKLLEDLGEIEREQNKERAKLARQAARDAAAARVTELKAANEQLYVQIEANEAEIKQQTALANAPEPDDEKKSSKKKG